MTAPTFAGPRGSGDRLVDRRRFLLISLAGALATPVAAEAQQAGKVYRVGLLSMGTFNPDVPMWNGFIAAMREHGYVEGRNLIIRRGAAGDGQPGRLPEFVAGFLRDGVDVIVTTSTRE